MASRLLALCIGGMMAAMPASTESAVANGDTRTIYLHHAHTKESIAATYLVDGQYDSTVLEKLNWFLRDWRRDEATRMDPRLFDVVWEVYRESGSSQPIEVMSAYRSAETNAMLRRRSRQVAEHSQHILGRAMDQHYVDVPMSRIRDIAMRLQRGGVGFYPTAGSPFVHMDVGGVRHWPRMSYDQLSRLFPDGKTVHIPSNGQPLPGYEEARAELEARGDRFNYPTASEVKSKGFFAWLFGGGEDEDEAAAAHDTRRGPRMASLDPQAGTGFAGGASVTTSKNGGAQAFTLSQSAPASALAEPGLAEQRRLLAQTQEAQRQAAARAAAEAELQRQQQLAAAEAQQRQSQAEAQAEQQRQQQVLAQAMAAQAEKARAEAEAAAAVQVASAAPPAAAPESPQLVAAMPAGATTAFAVPLPPRRPVELAAPGPEAPLPPDRPTEFASLTPGAADQPAGSAAPRKDAIATLMAQQQIAGRAVVLPAAITQGPPGSRSTPPLPPVLAYASQAVAPLPKAPPASRVAVPLPVARPAEFVAARLDRSNFRALTASGAANRLPARSAIGSSVAALRPAAQSNLGILVGQVSPGAARAFGSKATELPTDRFAGPAIKPLEHVTTSATAGTGQFRSATTE